MLGYKINEIFYSLQGEGANTGTPAIFIRFAGCNLKCPFCDTDFTKFQVWNLREIEAWLGEQEHLPDLVVLTGGEPTLQIDDKLCELLHLFFHTIAIETNGTHRVLESVDFITFSPKDDFCGNAESIIGSANEVKVVFDGERNPEFWHTHITADYYYLQPCDTGEENKNKDIREKLIEYIKEHPWWRLSLQTQKILKVR